MTIFGKSCDRQCYNKGYKRRWSTIPWIFYMLPDIYRTYKGIWHWQHVGKLFATKLKIQIQKYRYLLAYLTHRVMWGIATTLYLSSSSVIVCILILFSETTGSIRTKFGRNVYWVVPYKVYVFVHPSVVRHKLSHLNLLLWNHWTKLNHIWLGWAFVTSI